MTWKTGDGKTILFGNRVVRHIDGKRVVEERAVAEMTTHEDTTKPGYGPIIEGKK